MITIYRFVVVSFFLAALSFSTPAQVNPHAEEVLTLRRDQELKASPAIKAKLAQLRDLKVQNKWTFSPVFTTALEYDLANIAGSKIPTNFKEFVTQQNALAAVKMKAYKGARKFQAPQATNANQTRFDWRTQSCVSPVKDQRNCGSCWIFSAHGAMEGAWAVDNGSIVDTSEQNTLDCNGAGKGCGGGWPSDALSYLESSGSATEASYPYTAQRATCMRHPQPYKVYTWGYVGSDDGIPSVSKIKQALISYGPLSSCVIATEAFQSYGTGEVFNEHAGGDVNHCVTIIGWDDTKNAWIIKNSWGSGWGDNCGFGLQAGYMYIDYGSNKIGYAAAWVVVQTVETNTTPSTQSWTVRDPIVNRKDPVTYDGVNIAPKILFQAGDKVEITAGGCVQTGGVGKTWKRYVNPSGPNSDRLYTGTIQIPGLTNGLVPLRSLPGQYSATNKDVYTINFSGAIPDGLPESQRYLTLGYVDDGYGDNGYWGHDDGTEDQCQNVGNAWVSVSVTHRATQ